ncbi:hypothetical protein [Lentzea sp. NPDC004782]|uniref:hypothetical protein n=1 Tax=Lentzea sp. NPDC004782 TaxID=3154458 RepID=UPI0033BE71BD
MTAPRIDTPLGPVTFTVRSDVDHEVVAGPAAPVLPDHYPPVTLWTATWRFPAGRPVNGFEVVAGLTTTGAEGSPDSGYRLDAVTFENATTVLSIGGPNEEQLLEEFGLESSVWYLDDLTLRWRLPAFEPSRDVQLALAVAWGEPSELPATWWAVDLP